MTVTFTWEHEPFFGPQSWCCRSDLAPEIYNPLLVGIIEPGWFGIGWRWRCTQGADLRGWRMSLREACRCVEDHTAAWWYRSQFRSEATTDPAGAVSRPRQGTSE